MDEIKFIFSEIKLIVGLGNIGQEYAGTRHNVGFAFVERLTQKRFLENKKLKSLVTDEKVFNNNLILSKPTTMMNSSGEAVQLIKNFYKFENRNILIVHDDLDLLIGNSKLQFAKGPKVHNGIASIENKLGSNKFWRLRIGVENRTIDTRKLIVGARYVLNRFEDDELNVLKDMSEKIINERFV